jgi:hypothetical protein
MARLAAVEQIQVGQRSRGWRTYIDFEWARQQRQRTLKVSEAVCFGDEDKLAELGAIYLGRGNRDLGTDLIDIAAFVRKNGKIFESTGLITEADLVKMETVGREIVEWTLRRGDDVGSRFAEQRAWTSMAKAYELIRCHAHPLYFGREDEWVTRYPSLFSPVPADRIRQRRAGGSTVEDEKSDAPAETAEPVADSPMPPS